MSNDSANSERNAGALADEQLVAYLDGELDDETSRRIEALLASDQQLRQQLGQLEQTWEALGELDRPEVDEQFTQTTLEMVAVAAEEDVQRHQDEAPRRKRREWLFGVVFLALAAAVGSLALLLVVPNANRRLLRDLPVVEHLAEYRQIDSIEFLRQLEAEHLFPESKKAPSPPAVKLVSDDQPLDERRSVVESMEPAEKERLRRDDESFLRLESAERDRIRALHEAIQSDPNAVELQRVMERYYQWLDTLDTYVRAELKDLRADARIERIKELLEDQKRRAEEREEAKKSPPLVWFNWRRVPGSPAFTTEDMDGLLRWVEEVGPKYNARFLESLPEDRREKVREELEKAKDPKRQREFLGLIWVEWQKENSGKLPPVTDEDLADLRSELSAEMRGWLEKLPEDAQRQTVARWVRFLVMWEYFLHRPQPASDQELAEFFEKKVDADQRRRLLSLPSDEMQRQLQFLYARSKWPEEAQDVPMPFFRHEWGGRAGGRGNFGPGRGGPGGPDGRFRPLGGHQQGGRGGRFQPGEGREGREFRGLSPPPESPSPDGPPPKKPPDEPPPR